MKQRRIDPRMSEERSFNLLRSLEHHRRDSYGFVLRPQHVQRYREYLSIFKEEEEERSEKWKAFLEQQEKSDQSCSSEDEDRERLPAETAKSREQTVSESGREGDDSSQNKPDFDHSTECDPGKEVHRSKEISNKEQPPEEPENEAQQSKESPNEIEISKEPEKEVRNLEDPEKEVQHCNNSSNESQISKDLEKKVHQPEEKDKDRQLSKERRRSEVKSWSLIRPSLRAIEALMSSRVKNRMSTRDRQITSNGDSLPPIKETDPGGESEDAEEEFCSKETSDNTTNASAENNTVDKEASPEPFFPWEQELEFLVQGGVPKDLRGEVWQAFVGVKVRRVERYYEEMLLLAEESGADETTDQNNSAGVPRKWRRQIEKVIRCMRLGLSIF